MVKIETYDPYEIDIAFSLAEGNITKVEGEAEFGQGDMLVFASPIKKYDFVKLTENDKEVAKAESGDEVIGQVIDNPRWEGARPTEGATAGEYTPRMATVRLFGHYVSAVQLEEDNEAVEVGDSVEFKGNNTWAVAEEDNGTRALYNADALSEGKITVLFDYYGADL